MTSNPASKLNIAIYQANNGTVEVRLQGQTVWLSLLQIAALFDRDKSVVSRHLRNIFKDVELTESATVAKNSTTQVEGGRQVNRQIELYNLDAIISMGYRVNSSKAARFRQWATSKLRQHLTQGYSLNRQRLEANAQKLEAALLLVRKIAQNPELPKEAGRGLLGSVTRYACTLLLLQSYEKISCI